MTYAVIDDYGDEPKTGSIAFESDSLEECLMWQENNNYHSASVVEIDEFGNRLYAGNR